VKIINPEYSVEKIVERIREAVASQGKTSAQSSGASGDGSAANGDWRASGDEINIKAEGEVPGISLQPPFQPRANDKYHVRDLLQYHNQDFIRNAYSAILKRPPEAAGYQGFMEGLRSGRLNKIDILAKLRFSEEGRAKKVRVEGLLLPSIIRKAYRFPILGYLLNVSVGIVRLPSMIQNQRRSEAHTLAQFEMIVEHLNQFGRVLQVQAQEQAAAHESLLKEASRFSRSVDDRMNSEVSQRQRQLATLSKDVQERVGRLFQKQQQVSSELVLQNQRLTRVLQEIQKRPEASFAADEMQVFAQEQVHALDAFYASFDEEFRGRREEIKERLRVYLPAIKDCEICSEATPILDVGCGRGEWLELLKEEGLPATGIDSNSILVLQCRDRGLQVTGAELMSYLAQVSDESLGAVTGFHIVEHLPVEILVAFLNETMRVLRPGGIVIFETPNPRNVLVGSCNFYFDPTHRNPLPSEVLKFLVESRGFEGVEVLPLNPSDEAPVAGDSELVQRFNQYFYGPMDYAVIGRKISDQTADDGR
jgi:2-polyprenyl-3-methyl-5-hydroxy-6-metoxy-1,4-benzoquinol methylase